MSTLLKLYPEEPFYRYTILIDGVSYRLDFSWNERLLNWYLDVYAADDTPLVLGTRVVINVDLFVRFTGVAIFRGMLVAGRTGELNEDPDYEDLGQSVTLAYFPDSELSAPASDLVVTPTVAA